MVLKTNWLPGESGLVSATNTAAAKINELENEVTDRLSPDALSATIGEQVGAALPTVDPRQFGAVGDGVANDSAPFQSAVSFLEASGGGAIVVARGCWYSIPDGVKLARNAPIPVSLLGQGGAIVGGTVTVGPEAPTASGLDVKGMRISGVKFDGLDQYGTRTLVSIGGVRNLDISGNVFMNAGVAIGTYGDTVFHSIAMLNVAENRFSGLMFGLYHPALVWDYASDWNVVDNIFNICADTPVWIGSSDGTQGGVDGLNLQGNTMFHLSTSQVANPLWESKRYNVLLGRTNWLRVINNNFFEAGLEAVYMRPPQNFVFEGNHIAWPGQRVKSDALRIGNGSNIRGVIQGNTFSLWTKAAIGIYTAVLDSIVIGPNAYEWSATNPKWMGGGALLASECFRVFADTDTTGYPTIPASAGALGVRDSIRGQYLQSRSSLAQRSALTSATRSMGVGAAGTSLMTVTDAINVGARAGGLVLVNVSKPGDDASTATYLLFLSRQGDVCTLLASGGKTAGATTNDPSFTWTYVGGSLIATPVGSTSTAQQWSFDVVSLGALQAR